MAFGQTMERIKSFAKSKEIKLIGDLPFYVSRDSVDVWSNKSLFSVSNNGDLIFQSGVLLIISHLTGQLWGTPTYFGQNTKEQNSNGGGKDLKDNLN